MCTEVSILDIISRKGWYGFVGFLGCGLFPFTVEWDSIMGIDSLHTEFHSYIGKLFHIFWVTSFTWAVNITCPSPSINPLVKYGTVETRPILSLAGPSNADKFWRKIIYIKTLPLNCSENWLWFNGERFFSFRKLVTVVVCQPNRQEKYPIQHIN